MPEDVSFHGVPLDAFPFTITARLADGTVVWSETVHRPGALHIPALGKRYGEPVHITITYASGGPTAP